MNFLLYNLSLKQPSGLTYWFLIKSIILFNLEEYSAASNQIEQAIILKADKEDYYRLKAKIFYKLDRNTEAVELLSRSIELNPEIPESYYLKAEILFYSKKPQEALNTINKGFELFPDHIEFYEIKNLILEALGRHDEALEGIEKAIKLGVKYQGLYYNKASLSDYLGRYDVALETINKELELDPNDSLSITLKIEILNELENFDKALNLLESKKEFIHRDDRDRDSYNNLKARIFYTKANVFARNNMREDAINAIETALKLTDPELADYTYKFGEILMILHDFKGAAEKFESALRLVMPPLDTKIRLGRCYYEIGQFEKALEYFEQGKYQAEHSIKQEIRDKDDKIIEMDVPQTELIEEAEKFIYEMTGKVFYTYLLEITLKDGTKKYYTNHTSNLYKRWNEDRRKANIRQAELKYYDTFTSIEEAAKRSKEIDKMSDKEKEELINSIYT